MRELSVKVSAMLDASPEAVYATIADYRQGHPAILPEKYLYDLQVEKGGYGAGTVIRFRSRILGVEQSFHHQVSEPTPGKVLVEQDVEQPRVTTTFTVLPAEQGKKAHVEIATMMAVSPGFKGLIERLLVPGALLPVYREELRLLGAVAGQRTTLSSGTAGNQPG